MRVWPVAAYDCADTAASTCILCAGGCGRNLCPHCDAQNQAYDDALQARIVVELAERDAAEAAAVAAAAAEEEEEQAERNAAEAAAAAAAAAEEEEQAERDAAEAALDKPTKQSAGVRCAPGGESTAWGALSLGVSAGALLLPLLPPPR
jgi:hypothetical protein